MERRLAMRIYKVVLVASVYLSVCAFGENSAETQWRTIYVTPGEGDPQKDCPVEHCYSLQDVFNNYLDFFGSHTTLELLPGVHYITKSVGQLVIPKVKHFALKGTSPNVTIICQPGASFGLTIVRSVSVEISNVKISHCSAKLHQVLRNTTNGTILTDGYILYVKRLIREFLKYDNRSCESRSFPACYGFLTSFRNKQLVIHKTSILHSKGVGLLTIDDSHLGIHESHLAFSQVNCICIVLDTTHTILSMSRSAIEFGQTKAQGFKFASGMNLYVRVFEGSHYISLRDVTLTDNTGAYGNFYVAVLANSASLQHENIDLIIKITNISSIQTGVDSTARYMYNHGLIVEYNVQLSEFDQNSWCARSYFNGHNNSHCYLWLSRPDDFSRLVRVKIEKNVEIALQNIVLTGSCI